jgi:hypothetical protein
MMVGNDMKERAAEEQKLKEADRKLEQICIAEKQFVGRLDSLSMSLGD